MIALEEKIPSSSFYSKLQWDGWCNEDSEQKITDYIVTAAATECLFICNKNECQCALAFKTMLLGLHHLEPIVTFKRYLYAGR